MDALLQRGMLHRVASSGGAGLRPWAAAACFGAALFMAGPAGWMFAKAELAQGLLLRSWQAAVGGEIVRPWPWADTHAVARLTVPGLGIDQIVLDGDAARTLAFGPGGLRQRDSKLANAAANRLAPAGHYSGLPGADPDPPGWLLAGHRDTHFSFLTSLERGDLLILEVPQASTDAIQQPPRTTRYRVQSIQSAEAGATRFKLRPGLLALVTCTPRSRANEPGNGRLVVIAAVEAQASPAALLRSTAASLALPTSMRPVTAAVVAAARPNR